MRPLSVYCNTKVPRMSMRSVDCVLINSNRCDILTELLTIPSLPPQNTVRSIQQLSLRKTWYCILNLKNDYCPTIVGGFILDCQSVQFLIK